VLNDSKGGNSETVNNILTDALPEGKFIYDSQANATMHHKLAIVDANYPASDPQVITGSHNWSNSANDRNDENTLIIHSAEIANEYFQQFAYRFDENNGDLTVSADKIEMDALSLYPNPTKNILTISSPVLIKKIELFSISGAKIEETVLHDEYHKTIDLSGQIVGIYILKVSFKENKFNTYKVVKK